MRNFTIETSLPFPFIELNEIVRATEVKKPSGVSYMILVLLKESKFKDEYLASLLEMFGVPKVLHFIYADEIKKLIDQKIIKCNREYIPMHFSRYILDNFSFTSFGNKVFADEQISTGKEKESKIKCYYDVALNQLSLKPNPDLEVKPLQSNEFDEKFVLKFECKKNVEDFLNSQKGPSFQVKAAEVITNVELYEKKSFVGKYNAKFMIDGDEVHIKLDHKLVQDFFDKYYNANIINKAILLKDKFKLENSYTARLSEFQDHINNVILPKEISQIMSKKYSLVLTRDNYKLNKQSLIIKDNYSVNKISQYANFVCVDGSQVYAYCPVNLELNEPKLGKIYLPLILVLKPSLEDLTQALTNYIDSKKEYTYDSYKEIVSICNITKNYSKTISILESYMTKHEDNNIIILNEVKQLLTSNSNLLNDYKTILHKSYNNYMKSITEDSLESALKITSSIPSFLGIKSSDILQIIMNSIKSPKHIIKTYETLVKYFNRNLVLPYVNPFESALKNTNLKSEQLLDISTFYNSLEMLKQITGIKNAKKYTFNEDELIKPEFKKNYITANNAYKNILVYKPYNKEYFDNAECFMSVFERLNDNLNVLEAALNNPKNIKADLIEKKIVSGDYQFVLINLAAKLDLLLKEKFKLKGTLSDKLNEARKEKYLSNDIVSDLHIFRGNRNALAHPEDRQVIYDANDLRRWSQEIFDIEEAAE